MDINNEETIESNTKSDKREYKLQIVWRNVIILSLLHIGAPYGMYLAFYSNTFKNPFFFAFIALSSSFGVQCGAHRLWCHRTYKAKLPLQLLLAFFFTMALQNDIYEWSRDHRVHHKYSETDADPHNAKRGFFFAHVGWLLCKKHPEVIEKGKTIDFSDLKKDRLVQFQRKFYIPLVILIWGLIPTYIPHYFWSESLWNSFFIFVVFRYVLTLNITWLVNSASHLYGMKPYDKTINPVECTVRHLLMGEGFHNYHHTFPWDYSASEFGALDVFNPATAFIDLMAKIGWAYDLRKASNNVVKSRQAKMGDLAFVRNSRFYELTTGLLTVLALSSPFVLSFYFRSSTKA